MKKLIASILIFSAPAFGNMQYVEVPDDFSNEMVYKLAVFDTTDKYGAVVLQCIPNHGIEFGLHLANEFGLTSDRPSLDSNKVSITHKFDNAENAYTEQWIMNDMVGGSTWFPGDYQVFVNELMAANQLNIRLDKRNNVYRFKVEGASEHIKKIVEACDGEISQAVSHT